MVKVHCCGATSWIVHVPAIDRWALVLDKAAIEPTAEAMIHDRTGHPTTTFTLNLTPGRALPHLRDWHSLGNLQQWKPPAPQPGKPDSERS